MTMTVESGVTLRQLINDAVKAGLALAYAPYWWGLTIGGLLGTGAHGSSLWGKGSSVHDYVVEMRIASPAGPEEGYAKIRAHGSSLWGKGSSVHDYVVEMRIVSPAGPEEGYTKIRVLNERDKDLDAAKVSLGVLGVISQAVYRIDDRVSSNASRNGLYDFTPFRSTPSLALALVRTTEETQESLRDANGKCLSAKLVISTLQTAAYGLTNNGINFTGYPVTGFHDRLQSSGTCLDSLDDSLITACAWDPRIKGEFFQQTTFSIGLSVVKNFIEGLQKLVALEPKALCGLELYNGILLRYVKNSSAYLGKQEDAIDFDITYYRSKDPIVPRLYQDILEEIEQIVLFKHGALPYWGKNRNLAFDGVMKKYKKWWRILEG
ncbi:hypothetical protein CRYUN_Cryun01aG0210000 [Craigia yunnanensis]